MFAAALLWFLQDALFFLSYVSNHASFPQPLSAPEERDCIARMRQGDRDARGKLIEHNLRLVAHIARKYTVPGQDADDLISIGTIGLIKAVSTFKPESGTQLATYASRCIENEILMTLRAAQRRRNDVSLQDPIGVDAEGNEITLIDVLGTDGDIVPDEVDRRISLQKVRALMTDCLPERERTVIELRYGLLDGKPRPQYEIADALGISRSYVSRIEKRAILLLEQALHKR